MALEIFKLFGSIMVDSAAAEDSIQKTDEKAEGLGKKLQSGIKTAGKWAAGLTAGAAAVGGAMLKSAKDTAANMDVIDKASKRMGIGAESYQELAHAANLSGVEMSTLEKAAKKLEGKDLNLDDALAQIYELGTEEERSAKAAELFGESVAYSMGPMLMASADDMAAMKQEARDLGLVMSEDTVKAGADMNDAFSKIEASLGAVKNEVGAALMPIISELLDWVIKHMPEIQASIKKVTDFLVKAIQGAMPYIEELKPVFEGVFKGIGALWENVLKPILTGLITFLSGVFTGDWKKAWEGLSNIVSTIFKALIEVVKLPINGIIKLLNGAIDGFNKIQIPDWVPAVGGKGLNIPHIPMLAEGGDITEAGTVLVGEKGPEFLNLPTGARVTPLDKATQIDYDEIEERFTKALMKVAPMLRNNVQISADSRGIFNLVRDAALDYEASTGEPAFLN